MEEPNPQIDLVQPDPLLKSGAFIDPNPSSHGSSIPNSSSSPAVAPNPIDQKGGATSNGKLKPESSTVNPGGATVEAAQSADQREEILVVPTPGWLPPGWTCKARIRASGASAGSRDKYYIDPVTQRRFRSKKEVLYYLETGSTQKKRKNADSEADNTPGAVSASTKRKKSESKVKDSWKNFNFDDVPVKVKWVLTDIYEGTWKPLNNGVQKVPESAKHEWSAAFTYLSLHSASRAGFV